MEPAALRTLYTLFFSLLLFSSQADNSYDREEVKQRVMAMDCIVKPRYTSTVENYIKAYFAHDGRQARLILTRTATFFPIFEKYLREHDMPEDLKYLAIVESALDPKAVSRVGATGLWQFMKETGTSYGLRINSRVDERSCPNRSTEAAMKYLDRAYQRFGSWELAIASYNCGPGNVSRAIRRAGTEDYWRLSRYLPRETRNFVPAFLGAAYLMKYYHEHDVLPEYPNLDLQLTESSKVYTEINLETIAAVCGLPVEVVEKLNPAFKKNYIPAYSKGHFVVLPKRVIAALKDYLHMLRPDSGEATEELELPVLVDSSTYFPENYYHISYYTVAPEDEADKLCNLFGCTEYNLMAWNNLPSGKISSGQQLVVYFPKELRRFQYKNEMIELLPVLTPASPPVARTWPVTPKIRPIEPIALSPVVIPETILPLPDPQDELKMWQLEQSDEEGFKIKTVFYKTGLFFRNMSPFGKNKEKDN